jgi:hypothetical protein
LAQSGGQRSAGLLDPDAKRAMNGPQRRAFRRGVIADILPA